MSDGAATGLLTAIDTVVAGLDQADRDGLVEAERALLRSQHSLDAARIRVDARLDVVGVPDQVFGLKTPAWIAREGHLSGAEANGRVRVARKAVLWFPELVKALDAGEISYDHLKVVCRVANRRNIDSLSALQHKILEWADGLVFKAWKQDIESLGDLLDEDGGHDPNDDVETNSLRLQTGLWGLLTLEATFTAEHAAVVKHALETKADQLYQEAVRDHAVSGDIEIPSRRALLARAFAECCRESLAVDLDATQGPAVEATLVLFADDDLANTITDGDDDGDGGDGVRVQPGDQLGDPDPETIDNDEHVEDDDIEDGGVGAGGKRLIWPVRDERRRLMIQAGIRCDHDDDLACLACDDHVDPKAVLWVSGRMFGDDDTTVELQDGSVRALRCASIITTVVANTLGVPLDLGRTIRLANRAQRRAIQQRDGRCVFPGCTATFSWCDIHHVEHWEKGGTTNIANLVALCRYHHGVVHRNGWMMFGTRDGWFWFQSPSGETFWSQRHGKRRPGPPPRARPPNHAT